MSLPTKSLLSESSIHGLRFMSDSAQKKFVRFFWLLAFVTSIAGMSYYAKGIIYKWINQPDVGHFTRSLPIRDVPFPAITICSPLTIKSEHADYEKFTRVRKANGSLDEVFSSEEQKKLSALIQACRVMETSLVGVKLKENPSEIVKHLEEGMRLRPRALT